MRYLSIDILRGLAILLMIQVHFSDNLSTRQESSGWLYDLSSWLGMIPAPLFTFLSGVSYCLWLRKQVALNRSETDITKVTVRRGLFLFGAGIAFNALVWLPEDTFDWDILTLLGVSLLLLAYIRHLPAPVIAVLCCLILLVSPPMRVATDYPAYWEDLAYYPESTLTDVVYGFFANGYFPVFPWIVFPLLGFVIGDVIFPRQGRTAAVPRWVTATGFSFVIFALLALIVGKHLPGLIAKYYLTGFTMFPASTEYVIGTLGLSMVGLVLLSRWIDNNPRITGKGWFLTFFRRFSAFSLTVYILHHMAHLWPLWIYGTWKTDDPTVYWREAMSTPLALALAGAFVIVCYGLLIVLERHGKASFESVMRWICE